MSTGLTDPVADDRRRAMLRTAFGPAIAAALADPLVVEVMVNPDGCLRLDRLGEGRVDTGVRLDGSQVERIIRLVASHARAEVHAAAPIISAELPPHGGGAGERFEGVLPPVATGPCFAIRKPATRPYMLADYVADGIMSAEAARLLSLAVVERRNILVAGGTSSGKTTLANALLAEMAHLDERVILIEDTRELQSSAPDTVALRTRPGVVSMADLVRSTLRLRPDRIIVGEVRGPEALDMLNAWNTDARRVRLAGPRRPRARPPAAFRVPASRRSAPARAPRLRRSSLCLEQRVDAGGGGLGEEQVERFLAAQRHRRLDQILDRRLSLGFEAPPCPIGDTGALGGDCLRPAERDPPPPDAFAKLGTDFSMGL